MTTTSANQGAPSAAEPVAAFGAGFVVERLGPEAASLRLVWLHGWGQTRAAFRPLARRFAAQARNDLVDLPGFGDAPLPPGDWGTEDYGEMLAEWLAATRGAGKTVLVGHSFGARVALRLAARHGALVDGLVLIAGAGLRRRRSPMARLKLRIVRMALGTAKLIDGLAPTGLAEALRERLGSEDYRRAGPLRGVLVRAVSEDLTETARAVAAPALLVYGALDDQTPPELGERFAALMGAARLVRLPGFDHYSILAGGRHQVERLMRGFLRETLGLAL